MPGGKSFSANFWVPVLFGLGFFLCLFLVCEAALICRTGDGIDFCPIGIDNACYVGECTKPPTPDHKLAGCTGEIKRDDVCNNIVKKICEFAKWGTAKNCSTCRTSKCNDPKNPPNEDFNLDPNFVPPNSTTTSVPISSKSTAGPTPSDGQGSDSVGGPNFDWMIFIGGIVLVMVLI